MTTARRIFANNIHLNILEQGSGPLSLVFLHYFGGSALEWQFVMNPLANYYHCVAIDLRGFGNSDAPPSGYSVNDMADDIAATLKTLQIERAVVIGHSMSGKAALALAARQPAELQSLILVSPSPPVPEPIPDQERQKLLQGHGRRSGAEQTLKNITAASVSENVKEQIIADDLRTSKVAWDAWLMAGSKENIAGQLSSINIPVSIIVGTSDRALPPDVQTKLVIPYLKTASLDMIENAGHLLPWEVPEQLADFILKKIWAG
ncbi:alpha/beta hydrolase [Spirosoma sp. SC4-14]|uniref:alpha/beta fold hydrolase n=1 Tax=Spirosoma sp. SC4-14 TaxID=3128900 RepID=UPI0030CF149E